MHCILKLYQYILSSFLLIGIVAIPIECYSQNWSPYHQTFGIKEGMPSLEVYDLEKDAEGFIWLASSNGIAKFDGKRFTNYKIQDPFNNEITQIYIDNLNRIWLTNLEKQLFLFSNGSFKNILDYSKDLGIRKNKLSFITKSDNIYYSSDNIIKIANINHADKIIHTIDHQNNIIDIIQYKNKIYFYDNKGLYELLDNLVIKNICIFSAFTINKLAIIGSSNHQLSILLPGYKENYLYHIQDNLPGQTIFEAPKNLIENNTEFLYSGKEYWIASMKGVWSNQISENPIFGDVAISDILKDNEGNYWFSSLKFGLKVIPNNELKYLKLKDDVINKIYLWNNKTILGSQTGSLYIKDVNGNFISNINLGDYQIDAIQGFNEQEIWVSSKSIYLINLKTNNFNPVFENISIKSFKQGPQKSILFAATGSIGIIYQGNYPNELNHIRKMFSGKSVSKTGWTMEYISLNERCKDIIYNELDNSLIYASNLGLRKVTEFKIETIDQTNATYTIKKGNQLYICSSTKGIIELDLRKGIAKNIISNGAIESNGRYLKIKIQDNTLWILTENGIISKGINDLNEKRYNLEMGIPYSEFYDFEILDDKVYLASGDGIFEINKNILPSPKLRLPLIIESFTANGKILNPYNKNILPHHVNNIEISLSTITFKLAENAKFQYKIKNISEDWNDLEGGKSTIKLASLSPGDYQIEIRVFSSLSQVKSEIKTLYFTIEKPWWFTWWAWTIWILFPFISLYIFFRLRFVNLRNQNILLGEKIQLEKELRASWLTSIRAQMNPHFLFNALNTIQSFIYLKDKELAAKYLSKFSELTRLVLDLSSRELITVKDEIKMVESYCSLEKLRFTEQFEYFIKIEPSVITSNFMIPPMIIQPYVENAIRHGLMHKRTDRRLDIYFEYIEKEDLLKVIIDDNGVGRKASEEINKNKSRQHNSFASEANKKRLEILNAERSREISVEIIDKLTREGKPLGTLVIINIPTFAN